MKWNVMTGMFPENNKTTRKEEKAMKKSLVAMAVGLTLSAGAAYAGPLDSFNLLNPNTATFVTMDNLDWSSSGSGLVEGLGPVGTPVPTGTAFTFDYQATLVGATLGGSANATPSLTTFNSDVGAGLFEYSIVARFNELVIDGSAAIGDNLIFKTTGGTFAIYANPVGTTAVVGTGVGFDDGTLVVKGSIAPDQFSSFLPLGPDSGIGSALIEGFLDTGSINAAFLDPISAGLKLQLFDIRFEGTQNAPPLDSLTTGFFIGGDPVMFADRPVTGSDIVLKVDGSTKLSVVPEPSTYLLLGMGLLGLVGYSRKRAK